MRTFLVLALLFLPGCPGPDMIVAAPDSGFFGDAALQDAGVDAYTAPEQDGGVELDAAPAVDAAPVAADAGPVALDRWELRWSLVFASGGFPADAGVPMTGPGCTSGTGDLPVNCVSQDLAAAYCASQGQRLPTRAEWLEEASAFPAAADEIVGASGPAMRGGGTCTAALCDTYGNLAEWVAEPGIAMGGAYDDPAPSLRERSVPGPDVHVGFRCRTP